MVIGRSVVSRAWSQTRSLTRTILPPPSAPLFAVLCRSRSIRSLLLTLFRSQSVELIGTGTASSPKTVQARRCTSPTVCESVPLHQFSMCKTHNDIGQTFSLNLALHDASRLTRDEPCTAHDIVNASRTGVNAEYWTNTGGCKPFVTMRYIELRFLDNYGADTIELRSAKFYESVRLESELTDAERWMVVYSCVGAATVVFVLALAGAHEVLTRQVFRRKHGQLLGLNRIQTNPKWFNIFLTLGGGSRCVSLVVMAWITRNNFNYAIVQHTPFFVIMVMCDRIAVLCIFVANTVIVGFFGECHDNFTVLHANEKLLQIHSFAQSGSDGSGHMAMLGTAGDSKSNGQKLCQYRTVDRVMFLWMFIVDVVLFIFLVANGPSKYSDVMLATHSPRRLVYVIFYVLLWIVMYRITRHLRKDIVVVGGGVAPGLRRQIQAVFICLTICFCLTVLGEATISCGVGVPRATFDSGMNESALHRVWHRADTVCNLQLSKFAHCRSNTALCNRTKHCLDASNNGCPTNTSLLDPTCHSTVFEDCAVCAYDTPCGRPPNTFFTPLAGTSNGGAGDDTVLVTRCPVAYKMLCYTNYIEKCFDHNEGCWNGPQNTSWVGAAAGCRGLEICASCYPESRCGLDASAASKLGGENGTFWDQFWAAEDAMTQSERYGNCMYEEIHEQVNAERANVTGYALSRRCTEYSWRVAQPWMLMCEYKREVLVMVDAGSC